MIENETITRLETAKRALRDACFPLPSFEGALTELVRAVRADTRGRLVRLGQSGRHRAAPPLERQPAVGGCGHRFFEPDCDGCSGRQPQFARGGRR